MIDISSLSEAELVDLNHRIVERLKFLEYQRAHEKMLQFRLGQKVKFETTDGRTIEGTITKYNRKTVSLVTPQGQCWNVSPRLLKLSDPPPRKAERGSKKGGAKVVPIRKK